MRILQRWVTGLPAQLLGLVLISVLALGIVVALGGVSAHSQAMRSLIGARDERATRTAAATLAERLNSRVMLLQTLIAHADGGMDADGGSVEQLLAAAPALREAFDYGLVLLDAQGNVVWDWQPRIAWSWDERIAGPVYLRHSDEVPLVIAQVESADRTHRLLGAYSLSSIDVAGLLSPLRTSDQTVVLLVADDGHVLFRSGELPVESPAENVPGVGLALRGESGAFYVTGAEGQEWVVTFSPIALSGWGLVVQEPWEEVTSVAFRLSESAPLLLLPVAVLAVLALLFGLWRIVRPLQRLEQQASRLAWGDYDTIRTPVGGIAEIGDLQHALMRMAQQVQRAEHARQSYIGAITRGQEEERARLARELHDDTVQTLIALGQRVQMVERQLTRDPAGAREKLAELRQLVNQTLDDVRRLIRDMRPSYLEDLGLIPALKALCRDAATRHDLTVSFRSAGSDVRLAPDMEVALYRIAQEALNNVFRHARATQVEVVLAADEAITLTISDDGQGFEVPAHPADFAANGHFGLMTIAERVRLLGGTLTLESGPASGTTLTVKLKAEESQIKPTHEE